MPKPPTVGRILKYLILNGSGVETFSFGGGSTLWPVVVSARAPRAAGGKHALATSGAQGGRRAQGILLG